MAFFHVPVDMRSGVALETDPVMENQTEENIGRNVTGNHDITPWDVKPKIFTKGI